MSEQWAAIEAIEPRRLTELFRVQPDRLSRLTIEESGIRFDFAKTHLDDALIDAFLALAKVRDFTRAREALVAGNPVDVTEEHAADHLAEAGQVIAESV